MEDLVLPMRFLRVYGRLLTQTATFLPVAVKWKALEAFLAVSRGKSSCKIIIANGTTSSRNRTFNFEDMNVALEWWLIWNFNSVKLLGKNSRERWYE